MAISYFKDLRHWQQVTRDERYFCLELYNLVKGREREFLGHLARLDTMPGLQLRPEELDAEWELGFEVCFYRDYIKKLGYVHEGTRTFSIRTVTEPELVYNPDGSTFTRQMPLFPMKRTFDLCLFSEERIIIVEAKSNTGFDAGQAEAFLRDKLLIPRLLDRGIRVDVVGLGSSRYFENMMIFRRPLPPVLAGCYFTWRDAESFARDKGVDGHLFVQADASYQDFYKEDPEKII